MVDTVGSVEYIARIDTSQLASDAKKSEKIVDGVGDSFEGTADRSGKSFDGFATRIGVISGVVSAAFTRVTNSLADTVGSAIKRVDVLNNSQRTFENMGFTTQSVNDSMKQLTKSILGLPTPLDEAVTGMQLIASSTNDIGKSQKIFSALNNAILGFGGTTQDVSGAVIQLSQAFSNGRIDAQTWNSLIQSGLGPALGALAKQMGITAGQLKEGLSDGTISVQQFQDALIDMNTKGGGGMKSFQTIAKDATSGIGTGFQNMQTAVTRGLASIIQTIGAGNISGAVSTLGAVFEKALKSIAAVVGFIQNNAKVFQILAIIIGSVLTPFVLAYTAATIAAGITSLVAGAQMAAAWLLALGPIGLLIIAVTAVTALILTNFDTIKNALASAWSFIQSVFSNVWSFFNGVWTGVLNIFTNVGTAIGHAVGNAFKVAINGVLSFLENQINGIVNIINGALEAIDKLSPGSLPRLDKVKIPRLASGGIVQATPGGILANIGEGGQDEAIIPLSELDKIMQSDGSHKQNGQIVVNLNMSGIMARSRNDLRDIAKDLISSVNEELRAKGQPLIGGGAI